MVPKLSLKLQYSFRVTSFPDSTVPRTYKNFIPLSSAHSIDWGIKTVMVSVPEIRDGGTFQVRLQSHLPFEFVEFEDLPHNGDCFGGRQAGVELSGVERSTCYLHGAKIII